MILNQVYSGLWVTVETDVSSKRRQLYEMNLGMLYNANIGGSMKLIYKTVVVYWMLTSKRVAPQTSTVPLESS